MWLYLGLLIKFRASCMTYRVDINFKKWWDRKLDWGRFLSKEMRIENSWKGWMLISCCFLDKLFPEVLKSLHFPWIGKKWECGVFTHERGWDGWMASLTQWTWVWASSTCWWWTRKSCVLQFMELQSQTWQSNWTELNTCLNPVSECRTTLRSPANAEPGGLMLLIEMRLHWGSV